MRGRKGRTGVLRADRTSYATTRLPTGGNTYGNGVPVVAQRPGENLGHGEGEQDRAASDKKGNSYE